MITFDCRKKKVRESEQGQSFLLKTLIEREEKIQQGKKEKEKAVCPSKELQGSII